VNSCRNPLSVQHNFSQPLCRTNEQFPLAPVSVSTKLYLSLPYGRMDTGARRQVQGGALAPTWILLLKMFLMTPYIYQGYNKKRISTMFELLVVVREG